MVMTSNCLVTVAIFFPFSCALPYVSDFVFCATLFFLIFLDRSWALRSCACVSQSDVVPAGKVKAFLFKMVKAIERVASQRWKDQNFITFFFFYSLQRILSSRVFSLSFLLSMRILSLRQLRNEKKKKITINFCSKLIVCEQLCLKESQLAVRIFTMASQKEKKQYIKIRLNKKIK